MKIELAYSLDIKKELDPEAAYIHYWNNDIKSKKNFECIADNCSAKITCANLDKLRRDMKKSPYYVTVEDHSPDCKWVKRTEEEKINTKNNKGKRKSKELNTQTDNFMLNRPTNHTKKIICTKSDQFKSNTKNHQNIKKEINKKIGSITKRNSTYYCLSSLVSKYGNYKKENKLDKNSIKINSTISIKYSDMFVEINNQNIKELSKYKRIYFGNAYINKARTGDGFIIIFINKFKNDDSEIRPSFYIPNTLIENNVTSPYWKKRIADLASSTINKSTVFIYGKPTLKEDSKNKEKKYINFYVNSLDHIDFRYQDK